MYMFTSAGTGRLMVGSYDRLGFATGIDHYARTVSEWSKDNTVSFGLRDMIGRFRDCLGR